MTDTMVELYDQFVALVEAGDEEATRKFLTDNFAKFPEAVQEELTMAFFKEALENASQGEDAIAAFQKDGAELIQKLAEDRDQLDKDQKIYDLKASM